jgi:uncharacterized iron-regulated membrane protein
MPHLLALLLVPLLPLSGLALLLWLDRIEETLDRDVDRRRERANARQAQLEASLAVVPVPPASAVSAVSSPSAPVVSSTADEDASVGGSTKR